MSDFKAISATLSCTERVDAAQTHYIQHSGAGWRESVQIHTQTLDTLT